MDSCTMQPITYEQTKMTMRTIWQRPRGKKQEKAEETKATAARVAWKKRAPVAESADALGLGPSGLTTRAGSTPARRTN